MFCLQYPLLRGTRFGQTHPNLIPTSPKCHISIGLLHPCEPCAHREMFQRKGICCHAHRRRSHGQVPLHHARTCSTKPSAKSRLKNGIPQPQQMPVGILSGNALVVAQGAPTVVPAAPQFNIYTSRPNLPRVTFQALVPPLQYFTSAQYINIPPLALLSAQPSGQLLQANHSQQGSQ